MAPLKSLLKNVTKTWSLYSPEKLTEKRRGGQQNNAPATDDSDGEPSIRADMSEQDDNNGPQNNYLVS